jgi:hypothetical protein
MATSLTGWHCHPPLSKIPARLLILNGTRLKHSVGKPSLVFVEGGGGYKSNMFPQAWQSPRINHLVLQLKTGLASLCISKTTSKQHSSRKFSLVNSNELWVLGFSLFACACLENEFLEGFNVFLSGVVLLTCVSNHCYQIGLSYTFHSLFLGCVVSTLDLSH